MFDKPQYDHDCEACVFLGNANSKGSIKYDTDLYYCAGTTPDMMTFVARHSSEPSDYGSGICAVTGGEQYYKKAARIAIERDLMDAPRIKVLLEEFLR